MINLIIFIASFVAWLILIIKNKFKWYTFVLACIWGGFFVQTIAWLFGLPTLIK